MYIKNRFIFGEEGGDGGSNGGGQTLLGGAAGAADDGQQQQQGGEGEGVKAYDFRSSLGEDGNFRQGWTNDLPDDLKAANAILGKYPNPTEMARGLVNANRLIGQKSTLKAPAPDAKPEEVEKFNVQIRDVLGVPQKVDDYKLEKPASIPEGLTWNEEKAADFVKLAHSLNIPPQAAQKIAEWQMANMGDAVKQGQAQIDAWVQGQQAELKKDWGNDYDANLGKAARAAQLAGFDLNDGELANNAKFVKAMLTVSSLIKPDAVVGADKTGIPLDGAAQAEDIRRNPANPWHAAYNGKEGPARQKEAQALMMRLQGVKEDAA